MNNQNTTNCTAVIANTGNGQEAAAETKDLSVYVPEKVRKPGEIGFAQLWIIIGLLGYYFAMGMTSDSYSAPSVFPKLASTVIIACGAVSLAKAVKREKPAADEPGVFSFLLPRDVLVMMILMLLYCAALPKLHFVPSSFALLVSGMIYLYRGKKIVQSVIISACTLAVLVAVFRYVFLVILP